MTKSASQPSQLDLLAEDFADRYRRGERPAISEYIRNHPELAEEIEDLFPALAMIEQVDNDRRQLPQPPPPAAEFTEPHLQQLGDFRIVREAGRGGMGIVYEAEQVSLGRRVALKVLPQHLLAGQKQRKRFEREARAAARLHHTNIVPVFGVGEQEGVHYYVMQFIHGLGLDEVIVELKRLRQESAAGQATTQPKSLAVPAENEQQAAEAKPLPAAALPDSSVPASPVSAVDVAHSLLSGHFQRTVLVDGPSDNGSSSDSEGNPVSDPPPSTLNSQPSTPAADTAVGQLSDTAQHSFALPGQSTTEHGTTRKVYWESVARMGLQTAQALQYAHDQGVIHRDIKPGNLLLDTQGTVWVTDFGLAKATDQQDLTHTGDVLGTLRYMAPEQFEGSADARSDVYSLGLTLYELLALQPAFDQKDRRQLIKQVTEGTPARLRNLDHHIPKDLETIVHKAIDRDPSHRYQTAGDLAADLQRYLGDEPIRAKWVSPVKRFARWCKRNPAIASLTTTIALLLITAAIGSALAAVRFQDLADEKTELAGELTDALKDAEHNLELVQEQEQIAQENLALANSEAQRAEEALALVTAEQQRAEGNLDLALAALDAVYLDAIGEEKLLGEPISRPQPGDEDFSPSARVPLTDLEKELLKRGLKFYDQFAQQNAATPRAAVQTAQAHYRVGLLEAALGDYSAAESAYQAAVERFEQLTKEDPNNISYHRQLAEAYRGLGGSRPDWGEAKQAFQASRRAWSSAIELNPDDPELYRMRAAISHLFGDAKARLEDLERGLELDPDNVRLLRACAELYQWSPLAKLRNLDKARQMAERALMLSPDDPYSHLTLGEVLRYQGDNAQAKEHHDRAVELAPNSDGALNARGHYFLMTGELERASEDLNRALEINPEGTGALVNQGRVHRARGDLDAALRNYTHLLKINPHNFSALWRKGDVYLKQGKWQAAFDSLDQAIAINPSYWVLYKRRAVALFHLGRYEECLADLKCALELLPTDTSALLTIPPSVVAKCSNEEFREGLLEMAESAVARSSTPERARADRIGLYQHLGEDERIIREKIEEDPVRNHHASRSYRDRAAAFFRQKQYARALEDLRSALEITPDDSWILKRIPFAKVANSGDDEFKQGILALADKAVAHPDTDKATAHRNRAELLAAMGRPEAIDDYTWLIENEPDKPVWRLRRGRLRRDAGDEEGADADFEAYLKHHDEAIARDETDWRAWNRRGVALANVGRWEAGLNDFAKAAEIAPDKPLPHKNRKAVCLGHARWADAADALARLVELEAAGWREEYEQALLSLKNDQHAHYRDACHRMLAAGSETTDAVEANFIAWTVALAPEAVEEYDTPLALAGKALEAAADNHQYLNSRGALLYRAGRCDEALDQLTALSEQLDQPDAQANSSPAYCWYFLAMTHHALGQTDKVRTWLNKANDWTEQVLSEDQNPPPWNRRLTLKLLRDEATALIGPAADVDSSTGADNNRRPPAPPLPEPADSNGES